MQLKTAAESFRLSESKAKHYTVDSTYFFNTADLFSTAWRWQIFLWWNGLPGHNGRVSRIDNSLATAAEHLATDFKHDGRQQVPTVGTYLQHKRHLVLLHTLHKCHDVKQPEKKHLLQLHVKSNTSVVRLTLSILILSILVRHGMCGDGRDVIATMTS